jgi:hypothetical protein
MTVYPLPPIQWSDAEGDSATLGEVDGVTMGNVVIRPAAIGEIRFYPDFSRDWDDLGLTSSLPKAGVTLTLGTYVYKAKDGRSGTLGPAGAGDVITVTGKTVVTPPPPPPPPPPATVKAAVEGLKTRATPNGQPLRNLPSISTLSLSGLTVTATSVTYNGTGGVIDGYDFGNRQFVVNGQLLSCLNSVFTQAYGVAMPNGRRIVVNNGARIENFGFNEIIGTYGDRNGCQKMVLCSGSQTTQAHGGIQNFYRNRFVGHQMDCYSTMGGLCEENYFGPPSTIPKPSIPWPQPYTYRRDPADWRNTDFTRLNGFIYWPTVDNFTAPPGGAPSGSKADTADWLNIDLHGDAITMLGAYADLGGLIIRRNYVDWRHPDAPTEAYSMNNCLRLVRNNQSATFTVARDVYQVTVENNILVHGDLGNRWQSVPNQLGGGGTSLNMFGPFEVLNNWMTPNKGGQYWFKGGPTGRWVSNIDYDTNAAVPPPDATGWTLV